MTTPCTASSRGDLDEFGAAGRGRVVVTLAGDPMYAGVKPLEEQHRLADVRLLAPVIPRSKVVAIGSNYAAHAAEMGDEVPRGAADVPQAEHQRDRPGRPDLLPAAVAARRLRGRAGRGDRPDLPRRPAEQATDVIFGYTIANDVTARDLQKSDGQWSRAKGFDSFCPLGPWIETDLDPHDFAEGRSGADPPQRRPQAGRLDQGPDLRHPDARRPHHGSAMTLLPGDVILTGTPEGVGPMQVGDEVEVSIDGLGTLTNKVSTR